MRGQQSAKFAIANSKSSRFYRRNFKLNRYAEVSTIALTILNDIKLASQGCYFGRSLKNNMHFISMLIVTLLNFIGFYLSTK